MSEDKKQPEQETEEPEYRAVLRRFLKSQGKEFPEGPPDPERIKRMQNSMRLLQEQIRKQRESEK